MVLLRKLTDKQKKFCEFYVASGNATEAAIKAGYSEGHAKDGSYKMLEHLGISRYIKELQKESESARIADMIEVQEFWTKVLRDKNQYMKYRLKASEYIAKTNAAFTDNVNLGGELKINPFVELTTKDLKKLIKDD